MNDLIENMPESEYLSLPHASASRLSRLLDVSPLHARQDSSGNTPSTQLGSLVHKLLLEPVEAAHAIAVMPDNANLASNANKRIYRDFLMRATGQTSTAGAHETAEGKILSAEIDELLRPMLEASGKIICSEADHDTAKRCVDSVMTKELGRAIFANGQPEVTGIAEINGVICKVRFDWLMNDVGMIAELKTTCSMETFLSGYNQEDTLVSNDATKYGFHRKASLYSMVYEKITNKKTPKFVFVVVETQPPFDSALFELTDESIAAGKRDILFALERWKACEKSRKWPGIGIDPLSGEEHIQQLSVSRWAL